MDDYIIEQNAVYYLDDVQYVVNTSGSLQNIVESGDSNITGSLTATIYPAPTGTVTYNWQFYNTNTGSWQSLAGNRRFNGGDTNVLTGIGTSSGAFSNQQIRCEITVDGETLVTREYTMRFNKKESLEASESSIGEAIQLITTKTFPVATEAFMKNEMWLLGMGFFTLTFLGVFLHWLFRRGRR